MLPQVNLGAVASFGWMPAKVASRKWISRLAKENPASLDRDLLAHLFNEA